MFRPVLYGSTGRVRMFDCRIDKSGDMKTTLQNQFEQACIDFEEMSYLGFKRSEIIRKRAEILDLAVNIDQTERPFQSKTTLVKEICNAFKIDESEIFVKTRKREVVNARQVYIHTVLNTKVNIPNKIRHKGKISLYTVGQRIGGYNHATCLHSVKVVNVFYDTEKFYQELIPRLRKGVDLGLIAVPEMPEIEAKRCVEA